jgi:single-strand DNA-binding protein
MTDLNHVSLVGRLTKDANVKQVNTFNVLELSIACNRSVKKGEQWIDEVSYFDASYFTKGTKMADMLKKGTQIAIDGSLKQDRWQGKDGKNASRIVILADNVQLLGGNLGQQSPKHSVQQTATPDNFPNDIPF